MEEKKKTHQMSLVDDSQKASRREVNAQGLGTPIQAHNWI